MKTASMVSSQSGSTLEGEEGSQSEEQIIIPNYETGDANEVRGGLEDRGNIINNI